eukprot:CAMPEP_0119304304 /NCGR_PEP_ID=MMETSP1333-20130426/5560_1 /TAXON_ID=418940 /ORGANISM="Scyphosphaera apsteinii, Strain RCC1455" /LENGTH=174 /DNA_ID=CAMNT_0007307157 /DNA_START=133 /DNA_END=657 /DNA_ORIENTATION=+
MSATTSFYHDVLDLPIIYAREAVKSDDQVMQEHSQIERCIFGVATGAHVGAVLTEAADQAHISDNVLTLTVDTCQAVDAWAARLVKRGVTLEKPPTMNWGRNVYDVVFRDPDGHLCEIQCSIHPSIDAPVEVHSNPNVALQRARRWLPRLAYLGAGVLLGRTCSVPRIGDPLWV